MDYVGHPTGTPLLSNDNITARTFGGSIDVFTSELGK